MKVMMNLKHLLCQNFQVTSHHPDTTLSGWLSYSVLAMQFPVRYPNEQFDSNAVTWFEIPTVSIERAASFYETVLDRKLRPVPGPELSRMFPVGDGGVGGCLVERPHQKPVADGTLVYLNVDGTLDQVLERAQQNGGKLLVPRTAIGGGLGYYAVILDSEGGSGANF